MATQYVKRFLHDIGQRKILVKKEEPCRMFVNGVLRRCQSQWSKVDNVETKFKTKSNDASQVTEGPKEISKSDINPGFPKSNSVDNDPTVRNPRLELAWLTNALEPALEMCRRALPTTGNEAGSESLLPTSRSVSEILASIQRSKIGIRGWNLSDLTIGLYLIYLRQSSTNPIEDVKGIQISSDSIVHDLIYHIELAKGAYKDNVASIARHSMLQASNIVKHVKNSNVMRPGYYIGIDPCRRLVVFGIRGTHTISDLITDIVISSDSEITVDGYSTHFGAAEAARWFLSHEMGTIKKCLDKYKGFRLRFVGHSLGGATASLLAIMLHKKSSKELGFNPDIVSAVGYASPPCVSRELAENCADYVTTVVMQGDIVPRLSEASLTRLRNEILETDWMSVLDKEDWKNVVGLVTNAKQVMSSIQDVARKLADFAKFGSEATYAGLTVRKASPSLPMEPSTFEPAVSSIVEKGGSAFTVPEELFVPGSLYYLKRNVDIHVGGSTGEEALGTESFTLWKRHPGEHFQRIVLSSNLFSDHKCDSHYYALRDALKGLPRSVDEFLFR